MSIIFQAIHSGVCEAQYFSGILDDIVERWAFILKHLEATGQEKSFRFIIEEVILDRFIIVL